MEPASRTSPSVSVVMITYNHAPYIRKAIEGVLSQQTDFPIKLLIGEDRSTDGTLEIVNEYARAYPDRVCIVTSEKNVGAKKNVQRLEAACEGKYTAYCEGDDFWHDPLKLKKQVGFLEAHLDYSLVHTEFRSLEVASGRMVPNAARQPRDLADGNAYNDLLSGRRSILTLTVCVRNSALQSVLAECPEVYDPRFLMGDTQRWLELARRGKIKCLHEVTATHLLLPESISQSKNPQKVLRFIRSTKDILSHYVAKYDCPGDVGNAAISRAGIEVLRWACEAGDYEVARQALEEYRTLAAPNKWEARLCCFGSRSRFRRRMVRPALMGLKFKMRVLRKLSGFFAQTDR